MTAAPNAATCRSHLSLKQGHRVGAAYAVPTLVCDSTELEDDIGPLGPNFNELSADTVDGSDEADVRTRALLRRSSALAGRTRSSRAPTFTLVPELLQLSNRFKVVHTYWSSGYKMRVLRLSQSIVPCKALSGLPKSQSVPTCLDYC